MDHVGIYADTYTVNMYKCIYTLIRQKLLLGGWVFFGAKKVLLPLIVGLQCSFKQGKGKTNLKYIDDVGGPLPVIDRVVTPYKWGYANPTYRSYVRRGQIFWPNEARISQENLSA